MYLSHKNAVSHAAFFLLLVTLAENDSNNSPVGLNVIRKCLYLGWWDDEVDVRMMRWHTDVHTTDSFLYHCSLKISFLS